MSDDTIKRLRDAIAAGPTPGPWSLIPQHGAGPMLARQYVTGKQMQPTGLRLIAHFLQRGDSLPEDKANASLIAAASPDNIAALLDRLDKAEAENERMRSAINWACGYNEGPPHFGEQPEQDARYAWRHELRRRAGMPWKVERRAE